MNPILTSIFFGWVAKNHQLVQDTWNHLILLVIVATYKKDLDRHMSPLRWFMYILDFFRWYICSPEKLNEWPPKINDWKDVFSYWNFIPFQGGHVVFLLGGKHHHPQGETMACFTFFFPNNKSTRSFITIIHSTLDLWFGPWDFSSEKPNNETPDKWGPPANKGEIDPWKGDLPPLVGFCVQ